MTPQILLRQLRKRCTGSRIYSSLIWIGLCACSPFAAEPVPGPDKQGSGLLYGAAMGAGSGAVTGAQMTAGLGPGAWVGAGFGAVFGMLTGMGMDVLEEDQFKNQERLVSLRKKAWATEVLRDHYARRTKLFPNRDIFPADIFFASDNVKLSSQSRSLVREIAKLNHQRFPTSRIEVLSYVMASDPDSTFAKYLSGHRAEELALELVKAGLDARRVSAQGVVIPHPLVLDPHDRPGRYRQAIEFRFLDR